MSELRALAVRFLQKPRTTQKGIIDDLGLREDGDRDIPPHDYAVTVLGRVRAAGALDQLRAHPALAPADVEIRGQS